MPIVKNMTKSLQLRKVTPRWEWMRKLLSKGDLSATTLLERSEANSREGGLKSKEGKGEGIAACNG